MLAPNPAFDRDEFPPRSGSTRANADVARNAHALALLEAAARSGPERRRRLQQRVIVEYLPVARSIANRFRGRPDDTADIVQVACIGLAKAVQRFDPSLGDDLVSFAVPTITGEIKQYLRDTSWIVRPPRRLQELAQEVPAVQDQLERELCRTPGVADLAGALHRPAPLIAEALQCAASRAPLSLDAPLGQGDDTASLAEMLPTTDPGFSRTELALTLERASRVLTSEERRVLNLRFEDQLTQDEIAIECGISQMQVSRMLTNMLARLRATLVAEMTVV
ncbi:sigma-70 family RNA polymerase sigma factor [Leucobacter sp. USHLN153]|uniref:sigma-70 family RNA polymerase sigma factor n=1 Tax=Leucobacter sp. USHLN153 TaxID=3081268 RepID=UPI00301A31EF